MSLVLLRHKKLSCRYSQELHPNFSNLTRYPFAIRVAVGKELDLLEKQGIIEKVCHSEWAAPMVPVPKKDGRFRICKDYKVTVNQFLVVEQHPLPKPDDLFATLAGGKCFSKIDLSQAYLQVLLDEESRNCHHQHASRALPLYAAPVWRFLCTSPVSEADGLGITGNPRSRLLY